MRILATLGVAFFALWFGARPASAADGREVCVVTVCEDITHNTLYLVRRAVSEAAGRRASAVVIELDTNGGRVDATEEIIRVLEHAPMPVYAFINPKAYSAGAFISSATDKIFMSPGSVIGAATPVMMMPGQGVSELPDDFQEKLNSAMRALIRSTAQQKGHRADVFEAMVDADKGLTLDGKVIVEKGKLLTVTDQEAAEMFGEPPMPLLSAGTVKSVEELLEKVGLAGAIPFTVAPAGFEVLGRWITAISPLLILIGFVAIYIEIKTPGIGIPALVAAICFAVYFFGHYAAGLAGWEDVALFALGITLLVVEVFFLPGFGITGVLGLALILVGLVMGMTQRLPGGPILPSWKELQVPVIKVGVGFVGSIVAMLVLARWLPETAFFKRLELATTSPAPPPPVRQPTLPVGTVGVAETMLRPSGKGRFEGALLDVVTQGDMIEKDAMIRIIEAQGSRVVVARLN